MRAYLCLCKYLWVFVQKHRGPYGNVCGGLMPRVQVHDEDVKYLLVVQPPAMLVLGLDQAVHHVRARPGEAFCPRRPPLVQKTLQHRHQLLASLKYSAGALVSVSSACQYISIDFACKIIGRE